MGLTSRTTETALALLALGLPVGAVLLWSRVRGPRPVRVAQRLGMVGLAQACAVLLVFVVVNDQYVFFASWQDLLGTPAPVGQIVATGPAAHAAVRPAHAADGGRLVEHVIRGTRSGVTGEILVHLPQEYGSPAWAHRSFPVLELLSGWHSRPESLLGGLHLLDGMRKAESTGALQPVITVLPMINVALPRDTECTDVPGGPRVETWLTTDVRHYVATHFRALMTPHSWSIGGYSTGGYCAVKLALHHPDWYPSAVSLAGYFYAVRDSTTGDLWGGSRTLREHNSPLWLVTHRTPPAVDVLVFASRQDSDSWRSTEQFLRVARPPLRTFGLLVQRGGHNYKTLRLALPEMLAWMSAHVQGSGPAVHRA
ncbi:MAG: alpha/beta hydrolase-fold protein [Mycobacteriales bacterium]